MKGYLGEFPVDLAGTEMAGYTLADWALQWIEKYGQIDGEHHKTWVLDQVASILLGTPVIVTEARWESGCTERRMRLGIPSAKYAVFGSSRHQAGLVRAETDPHIRRGQSRPGVG